MRVLRVIVISLVCVMPAFGQAQHPDDLQPGVNTSAMPAQPAPTPPAAKAASAAPAAASGTSTAAKAAVPAGAGKAAKTGKAMDRIDLDTTQITGNKELPKVMYVVPWKRADLGDLTGKPANSLVDEVLQPVDRDVFNREERYYHTVAPEKSSADTQTGSPAAH
jgi:predicted lipid-binding transport protein (Tim44 family)